MFDSRCSHWITVGAVMAALAVATGAIAAHGIGGYLARNHIASTRELAGEPIPAAQKYLDDFKTAAQYQMYHALGLIAIGLVASFRPNRLLMAAGCCHLLGILMFCGGLYWLSLMAHVMSTEARHKVGLMAAAGGTAFIVGWCLLAAGACSCRTLSRETDEPA